MRTLSPERSLAVRLALGLEIACDPAELVRASRWLTTWCAAQEVAEEARHDLELALDEVVANVIEHGYGRRAADSIRLRLDGDGEMERLEIVDRAAAFNPLDAPPPGPRAEEGAGGLGITLLRHVMDHVAYARENGENRLVLERRRAGTRG